MQATNDRYFNIIIFITKNIQKIMKYFKYYTITVALTEGILTSLSKKMLNIIYVYNLYMYL